MTDRAAAGPAEEATTSAILTCLCAARQHDRVTFGDIVDAAGARAYGLALLLFALPEALPLPVAGMSALIGLPLMLLSAQVAVLGTEARLPEWLRKRSMPASVFRTVVTRALPMLRRLERVSRPRWQSLAGASRALGLVCLILAFVIALPIPFGNLPPAVCVVGIAFGMLQRDGVIVALSLIASVAVVVGLSTALVLTGGALLVALGWIDA